MEKLLTSAFTQLTSAETATTNFALLPHLIEASSNPSQDDLVEVSGFINSVYFESVRLFRNANKAAIFIIPDRQSLAKFKGNTIQECNTSHHLSHCLRLRKMPKFPVDS